MQKMVLWEMVLKNMGCGGYRVESIILEEYCLQEIGQRVLQERRL